MKRQIDKKRMHPFISIKMNLLLILIPALLWIGATSARSKILQPRCLLHSEQCTPESIPSFDRLSLNMEDSKADQYSFFTQNLSGVIAIATPITWNTVTFILGRMNGIVALVTTGKDLMFIFQAFVWNGLFTETSHLISQRPRPFVYMDPPQRGNDPAHYVSFYSGHTSFAATATFITFFYLLCRGAPSIILLFSAAIMEVLIISTAYFRILAGRHFLSDVICGAVAGSFIAWVVFTFHRKRGFFKKSSAHDHFIP